MDKITVKYLKMISNHSHLSSRSIAEIEDVANSFAAEVFAYLHKDMGYIQPVFPQVDNIDYMNSTFRISKRGLDFLSDLKKQYRDHLFSEVRGWITAAIAVAAFIKSFFF